MKYVGDSIMFRGCFAATGTDVLQKIHGIMRKDYLEILKLNLKTSAQRSKPRHHWVFQQDDDPKHSSKIVAKWLKNSNVMVMELALQRPDLNSIENWQNALKKFVRARRTRNLTKLYQYCQEGWKMNQAEDFQKLVED